MSELQFDEFSICMLKFMEDITNKPEWWRKVRDPVVSAKWKEEVLALDWAAYRSHGDFTKNMAEASDKLLPSSLIDRLQVAVKSLEDVPDHEKVWHPGSDGKVLDLVYPSLFPLLYGRSRIMHERITLDNCLELGGRGLIIPKPDESDVGEGRTFDWQGAPVELVSTKFQWLPCDVAIDDDGRPTIESYINILRPRKHSNLYPLVEELIQKSLPAWDIIYRWVRKFPVQRLTARKVGKRVAVSDVVPEKGNQSGGNESDVPMGYQDEDHLEIDNLAQPTASTGEKRGRQPGDTQETKRLKTDEADSEDYDDNKDEDDYDNDDSDSEDEQVREPSAYFRLSTKNIKRTGFFNKTPRIQVIVKFANIHLTPEKPSYNDGSWQARRGANITESQLAFRAPGNREKLGQRLNYQQYDHKSFEMVFAIRSSSDTLQEVGSSLTRPGRALFFSNLSQHKVRPFQLEDPAKPGYRKIAALFLVDPAVPVISTANVPPQQKHWSVVKDQDPEANEMVDVGSLSSRQKRWIRKAVWALTNGPFTYIPLLGDRGLCPQSPPSTSRRSNNRPLLTLRSNRTVALLTCIPTVETMSVLIEMNEAKKLQEELMKERIVLSKTVNEELRDVEWSFCEH
ncbi:hypothetical protein BDP81DRAFT_475680 [Colletotrichum phormii]|uniref:Uncharacterized protein n=1 Tax=Colletotrichum phormii TaxID=359342 RepID=A0AAI9ZHF7_9PEZI|nr:uncharacterized protein BDP81DRAFT_475680 [Colletotrichum phormii]KAK1623409.1 hypothetical protein BDP81DRAFT_475680 [Colletotrichum phormii]